MTGEVECKSLSADAGRKIHRKDFYRLLATIERELVQRAESGCREVLLVTLHDRLPSNTSRQRPLREALLRMVSDSELSSTDGDYFSVKREEFAPALEAARWSDQSTFYKACRAVYGDNAHIAGPMPDPGRCIVAMRSDLEDDTSKPWLEAMKEATLQFSALRPGFIAMQFNDLAVDELMRPRFRRRAEILTNAVCRRPDASHVAGVLVCPYRGLLADESGIAAPAFSLFNTESRFPIDPANYPAFYGAIPDEEFARLIHARP